MTCWGTIAAACHRNRPVVIDTSALIALLTGEPSAPRLIAALERDPVRLVSAATVLEATLVLLGRYGDGGDAPLDRLLRAMDAEIVPVTSLHLSIARDAALHFRRGKHSAALNFGDLFSYALAISIGEPLLFVGADFTATDVLTVAW